MVYAIISETDFGLEIRKDIKGTVSLEKYSYLLKGKGNL